MNIYTFSHLLSFISQFFLVINIIILLLMLATFILCSILQIHKDFYFYIEMNSVLITNMLIQASLPRTIYFDKSPLLTRIHCPTVCVFPEGLRGTHSLNSQMLGNVCLWPFYLKISGFKFLGSQFLYFRTLQLLPTDPDTEHVGEKSAANLVFTNHMT